MTRSEQQSKTAGVNVDEIASRMTEIGEQIQEGISEAGKQARRQIGELGMDETTIPDAFRGVPKVISPTVHAWLDAGVVSYFLGLGAWCAFRGKSGAAVAAFVNAGMVAGVSLLTDYDGNGRKPISFKLHGTLDAVQAATAAAGPMLHGFAGEPEAVFFYGQAANEVAVIAATDWDAGMPKRRRRRAA